MAAAVYSTIEDLVQSRVATGTRMMPLGRKRRRAGLVIPVYVKVYCSVENEEKGLSSGKAQDIGHGGAQQLSRENRVAEEWFADSPPSDWGFIQVVDNASIAQEFSFLNTEEALGAVYKLDENESTRWQALDAIVEYLDDRLNEGKFGKCNAMLMAAEPERLSDAAIVTLLGITKAAGKIPAMYGRKIFYCRARSIIATRRGSDDAANKLLQKYQ